MRAHEFITEVFDKPWTLISNTVYTNAFKQMILDSENNNDGSHLYVWQKDDDPTQLISRDFVNGFWEIHHTRVDWDTGEINVSSILMPKSLGGYGKDYPNVSYYSTMISLYWDLIDRGLPTKIVSDDFEIFKKYNKVLEKAVKDKPNLVISDIATEMVNGIKTYNRTVTKNSYGVISKPLNERQLTILNKVVNMSRDNYHEST
jgi:hypothetical protein